MSERVVVLGAGYAGCVAVQTLERELDDADVIWISDTDYHLVLHEVHRVVSDPTVRGKITIPVDAIKSDRTEFVRGRVSGLDVEARRVELADGDSVEYDYVLVALGSNTAFYGIPGMADRAHTVKSLDDALGIHEAVRDAGEAASRKEPARVVVGGGGLSGIQTAGEIAELRDHEGLPITITLVEALEEIMPRADPPVQRRIRRMLESRDVEVFTDDPITEVGPDEVYFDERSSLPYDVLVWAGGITGREALADTPVENDHRRLNTDATFRTSDERVFAVGDAAMVGLEGDPAPPTAQAAWDAAPVAATNVVRTIEGRPLERWTYQDKGTLISVGEDALTCELLYLPVGTLGGLPAVFLKKLVAARWIATVTSWRRGLAAWDAL